jgi:hypothetical protein
MSKETESSWGWTYTQAIESAECDSERVNCSLRFSAFRREALPNSNRSIVRSSENSNREPGEPGKRSKTSPGELPKGDRRPNRRLPFFSKSGAQLPRTAWEPE